MLANAQIDNSVLSVTRVTRNVTRMAFVKLDAGILNSTIWVLRPDLEIFITALLMAYPVELTEPTPTIKIRTLDDDDFVIPPGWYGMVEAAGPGLVDRARIDIADGMKALERLASPEPDSRSQDFEGRRLVRVDGGYIVLNFMRYRDKDHTAAERQRRLRERRKAGKSVTRDVVTVTRDVTHSLRDVTPALRDSNVMSHSQRSDSRDHRSDTDSDIDPSSAPPTERPPTPAERIYDAYPRKVGKRSAIASITAAIKRHPADKILAATTAYASAVAKWPSSDLRFVPHPATWINGGRYEDDPATWARNEPKNDAVPWQRDSAAIDHSKGFFTSIEP